MSEPSDSRRLNLRESLLKFLEPIRSQPGKEDSASHVSAARQERRGVPDSLFRQTCRTYVCFTVSGSFYFVTESSFRISCKTNVCFTESCCSCSSSDDPSLAFAGGSGAASSEEKHSQSDREIENAALFVTKSMRRATCGNKKCRCIFRFRRAGQEFFEEDAALRRPLICARVI